MTGSPVARPTCADGDQPAAAGAMQLGHQAALGAQRQPVRGVLDVAAGDHPPVVGEPGGADVEVASTARTRAQRPRRRGPQRVPVDRQRSAPTGPCATACRRRRVVAVAGWRRRAPASVVDVGGDEHELDRHRRRWSRVPDADRRAASDDRSPSRSAASPTQIARSAENPTTARPRTSSSAWTASRRCAARSASAKPNRPAPSRRRPVASCRRSARPGR